MSGAEALWFGPAVRPAREGVYEVQIPYLDQRAFSRWTGEFWCCWAVTPERAQMCRWPGIRDGYDWKAN